MKDKEEIILNDVKEQLNQIMIRLRINDIGPYEEDDYGNKKTSGSLWLSSLRTLCQALLEDLEKDEGAAETLAKYYYNSYCW